MKVLHIVTRHIKGGAARNLQFTLSWEARHGRQVHVALGVGSDMSLLPAGVEVHELHSLVRSVRPISDAVAVLEARRLITQIRPDVVHTHQSKAGIIGRLAARGRTPAIVHTIHMASFGPGYSRPASLAYCTAERLSSGVTDFYVSVGNDLRSLYLAAGIGASDRYHVIPSPLGVESYLPMRELSAPERAAVRQRFGLSADDRIVLAAGLLEPRKRFNLIIERLAPLLRRGGVQLVIAGEGPMADSLHAQIRSLGAHDAVRLLGYVNDMPELFAASNLFVHASSAEGVPQVVVQALAAGTPVVATTVEGLGDLPAGSVTAVDRDGRDLRDAVVRALGQRLQPALDPSYLMRWTEAAVAGELENFHDRLDQHLAARGVSALHAKSLRGT